jgi:FdhD protein
MEGSGARLASEPVRVLAVAGDAARERADRVAAEEPLEIRVAGPDGDTTRVAVTMRTPGDDFALAAGFLYCEGLVAGAEEITAIRYCADPGPAEQERNVVTVDLRGPFDATRLRRNFYATSSCGVCGKAAIEQVEVACRPLPDGPSVRASTVRGLAARLRAAQRTFERTGGLHATGLFDPEGELLLTREDVGRHNAMDKVVGVRLLAALPLAGMVAVVSGRASFEIVQKAAVAGLPVVCAVGAPSSLAVDTARRLALTLVGFLREDRFNVYSRPERILVDAPVTA